MHRAEKAGAALLGAGFLALGAWLPLEPSVPHGDSWAFQWSAARLAEHGEIRLTDWGAMSQLGQLLLAAPVALRLSADPGTLNRFTYGLALVTLGLFYASLRRTGVGAAPALVGTAILGLNTLYLAQATTYATEIFFLCYAFLGVLALTAWERTRRIPWLWAAGLGFALAALVRQHALAFAPAGLAWLWWAGRMRAAAVAPWLLVPLALAGFYLWLGTAHGIPRAFLVQQIELRERLADPVQLLRESARGLVYSAHYLGLFLLPALPLLRGGHGGRPRRAWIHGASLALVGVGTLILLRSGRQMPYLPSIIDTYQLRRLFEPLGLDIDTSALQAVLGAATALAGGLLLGRLVAALPSGRPTRESRREMPLRSFLLASAGLLLLFSLATGLHFDRHLLLPLPFLIAGLVAPAPGRRRLLASILLLAPLGVASVFFVDQRLRLSACTWRAAEAVLARGYAPVEVDGGFSFNGYHSYRYLSETFGRDETSPWHPSLHPTAAVVVRLSDDPAPRLRRIGGLRCENHLGFRPFDFGLFQRGPARAAPPG